MRAFFVAASCNNDPAVGVGSETCIEMRISPIRR
jgi:hypothetical protein